MTLNANDLVWSIKNGDLDQVKDFVEKQARNQLEIIFSSAINVAVCGFRTSTSMRKSAVEPPYITRLTTDRMMCWAI